MSAPIVDRLAQRLDDSICWPISGDNITRTGESCDTGQLWERVAERAGVRS